MMEERRDGVPDTILYWCHEGEGTQVHLLGFCILVWHLLRESKDREQSHGNFLESGVGKERIRGGQA